MDRFADGQISSGNSADTRASLDPRASLRRIKQLLDARPDLAPGYENAKRIIRVFRNPAFYEVTQRCNLFCEGCYYFEGDGSNKRQEQQSLAAWELFFQGEAARQVSMAYFVGAEPALEQERLLIASKYFTHANVGCNGSIRIDPAVPFRVVVSVWAGDDETDRKLRGASVFRKAFKNYRGDPRALILFTLTRWNLGSVRTIAEMCRDNELPLTFNMYSPTTTFLSKLNSHQPNDDEYFRVSQEGDSPIFSDEDLARVRHTVLDLMEDFPETVIYSKPYNDWVTQPAPLYEIDPATGRALRCGSLITAPLTYHGADLTRADVKCCTSDVDCSQCRLYSGGWSSKFQPSVRDLANEQNFADWLDMIAVLGRIVVYDHVAKAPETNKSLAAMAAE